MHDACSLVMPLVHNSVTGKLSSVYTPDLSQAEPWLCQGLQSPSSNSPATPNLFHLAWNNKQSTCAERAAET